MEFTATGVFAVMIAIGIGLLACFGFYALYETASSSGKIDYCYIDNVFGRSNGYEVIGHRPWRSDAHLGSAGSPEEANKILTNSVVCEGK